MAARRQRSDATRQKNQLFRQERERRSWSREQVAEWASRRAAERGFDETFTAEQIRRIEEHGVIPVPQRQDVLCELFDLPDERLGFPVPPAVFRRYDAPEGREASMERRTALKGLAGLLAVPLLDSAVEPLRRLADMSVPSAVEGCEELVAQLGYGYSGEPPARLLPRLRDLSTFTNAVSGLVTGQYARRFGSVAGWSSGLMANALFDVGDVSAAQPTIRLALAYGQQAGDARLVAYAYDRQGFFARERGDYAAALDYFEAGLREAPPVSAIRVRLLSQRARILARLQKRHDALVDLRELESEASRLPATELGEGSFHVNTLATAGATSGVLLCLGDLDGARSQTEVVIAHYGATSGALARPSRLAMAQLGLAIIALRQGQPDESVEHATAALRTKRMILPSRRALGQLSVELTDQYPQLPAARTFHDEFLSLSV